MASISAAIDTSCLLVDMLRMKWEKNTVICYGSGLGIPPAGSNLARSPVLPKIGLPSGGISLSTFITLKVSSSLVYILVFRKRSVFGTDRIFIFFRFSIHVHLFSVRQFFCFEILIANNMYSVNNSLISVLLSQRVRQVYFVTSQFNNLYVYWTWTNGNMWKTSI